jgi:hypothetical protein
MGVFYCLLVFDSRLLTALLSDSFAIGFLSYMVGIDRIIDAVIISKSLPFNSGYCSFSHIHNSRDVSSILLLILKAIGS